MIQKVAHKVLIENSPIRETIINWPDVYDFFIKVKVNRKSNLVLIHEDDETQIQRISRVYVSNKGGQLVKIMPPSPPKEGKECKGPRRSNQLSGWGVTVVNDLTNVEEYDINYDYYIQEVEKLCLPLQ